MKEMLIKLLVRAVTYCTAGIAVHYGLNTSSYSSEIEAFCAAGVSLAIAIAHDVWMHRKDTNTAASK